MSAVSLPGSDDRHAIAVLPFENFSGDPEQDYFADGITEDIITMLAGWRAFPVIARYSRARPSTSRRSERNWACAMSSRAASAKPAVECALQRS
jgi:TolB-like protein